MNKQALVKLATLKLAINHVLRQRMIKQAADTYRFQTNPNWQEDKDAVKEFFDAAEKDYARYSDERYNRGYWFPKKGPTFSLMDKDPFLAWDLINKHKLKFEDENTDDEDFSYTYKFPRSSSTIPLSQRDIAASLALDKLIRDNMPVGKGLPYSGKYPVRDQLQLGDSLLNLITLLGTSKKEEWDDPTELEKIMQDPRYPALSKQFKRIAKKIDNHYALQAFRDDIAQQLADSGDFDVYSGGTKVEPSK